MSAEWAKKERLAPGAQGTHHKICGAAGDASHGGSLAIVFNARDADLEVGEIGFMGQRAGQGRRPTGKGGKICRGTGGHAGIGNPTDSDSERLRIAPRSTVLTVYSVPTGRRGEEAMTGSG
jgi:hypothetical protein